MAESLIPLHAGGVVWTASISNWAMSRYVQCPVRECAGVIGGAADGLYKQTATGAVESYIRTGFLSVEGTTRLRTHYIYVYSQHSRNLSVEVQGVAGKQFVRSVYQQVIQPSETYHQARYAQIGRGYSTNHLQVGIIGNFVLRQIMLAVHPSYRRV